MCARSSPLAQGGWPFTSAKDWCGRWSSAAVSDPSIGPTGPAGPKGDRGDPGAGFDARTVLYYNEAQTINNQTITVRSIPIPPGSVYAFEIVASIINDVGDKAGVITALGTIARGFNGIFRPAVFNVTNMKNLGNSSVDVIANIAAQSADVQVAGTTAGAGTINWRVWTTIHKGEP